MQNIFRQRATSMRLLAANPETVGFVTELAAIRSGNSAQQSMNASQKRMLYTRHIKKFAQINRYKDLIIIDAASQDVLFSTEGKTHSNVNLSSIEFQDTGLTEVVEKVLSSYKGSVVDFEPYAPSAGIQSAFYVEPVFDSKNNIVAVMVVQLPPSFLTDIIESRKGMGKTGESYIVGWNKKNKRFELRSDLQTMGDGNYVTGAVLASNLNYWEDAVKYGLNGNSGNYIDSSGNNVLVAYNRLEVEGVEWYLISKIDKFEVAAPVRNIIKQMLIISFALTLLIGLAAFIIARKITIPIVEDMKFAQAVSEGDFDNSIALNQKDELGQLAKTLNRMARNLY